MLTCGKGRRSQGATVAKAPRKRSRKAASKQLKTPATPHDSLVDQAIVLDIMELLLDISSRRQAMEHYIQT